MLVYYNIVNNHYQQDSRVLHIFVPNKSSGRLSDFPNKFDFSKDI